MHCCRWHWWSTSIHLFMETIKCDTNDFNVIRWHRVKWFKFSLASITAYLLAARSPLLIGDGSTRHSHISCDEWITCDKKRNGIAVKAFDCFQWKIEIELKYIWILIVIAWSRSKECGGAHATIFLCVFVWFLLPEFIAIYLFLIISNWGLNPLPHLFSYLEFIASFKFSTGKSNGWVVCVFMVYDVCAVSVCVDSIMWHQRKNVSYAFSPLQR